jgi:hypothetical protein
MFVPPGYLSRAHVSIGVFIVVMTAGLLIVGTGASDSELQAVGGTAFVIAIFTLMGLIERLERQRERERESR